MAHRPYPNADRARRQLARRRAGVESAGGRHQPTLHEAGRRMQAALRGLPSATTLLQSPHSVDEYRLSTR